MMGKFTLTPAMLNETPEHIREEAIRFADAVAGIAEAYQLSDEAKIAVGFGMFAAACNDYDADIRSTAAACAEAAADALGQ